MKAALITGASGGIGRAIAVEAASQGYSLFLTGRNEARLEETRAKVLESLSSEDKVDVFIRVAELAGVSDCADIVRASVEQFGRLDLLVNNAGITMAKPVGGYSSEEWDRVMNINAKIPFFLIQEAIPYLKKADTGFIINICSIVSQKGYENQVLYSASKHALYGLTKSTARDLSKTNIRVHAVLPGGVDTDMVRTVRPDIDTSEMIQPEDIAASVGFLLKMKGNAVIDEIVVRRKTKTPWE